MQELPIVTKKHIVIFTRYPEAGKTKTRMIPALGEEGAANLQKQMTEHTLSQIRKLQKTSVITLEVRFSGGNYKLMQDWLGKDLVYKIQGSGDLGERMLRSLTGAFADNAQQVIIIGTDCPGLNCQIITTAFEKLNNCDLVLGPALDGGYYLVGLRQPVSELFSNISWGSDQVFTQTIKIAQKLNLTSSSLPSLADVDRPEDLKFWQQITNH
ncbi:MAG: glycosyltransferase [Sphaerospermopsis sp. SIO1G2]|nr:glycosyltransferase [Sphaerospermopsis sp. SIO1G2]